MKYSYKITLDVQQDAHNWYIGCNNTTYLSDWKRKAPKDVLDNIYNAEIESAYIFLIPYLEKKYISEKDEIDKYSAFIKHEFDEKFTKACQKVVDLLGRPLYRNDFTIFLTTFNRGPYDFSKGHLWICIGWFDPIENFLHELLHFQFTYYWQNNPKSKVSKLSDTQFDWIKESLTVILDEDLYPLIRMPDRGYEIHKNYRQKLHEFWLTNKDFSKLVDFGLEILPDYIKDN